MQFSRDFTLIINYLLDNICPPILRDSRFLMWPLMRLIYGGQCQKMMNFKDRLPYITEEELSTYYDSSFNETLITKRPTDLNSACLDYILKNIKGSSVLDAACGRGGLLKIISANHSNLTCAGCDIGPGQTTLGFDYTQTSLYSLPYQDSSFDTVLCTHALEHLLDYKKALNELTRIARQRLIIVVPRQREYKFTPDLHVHFLPYMYSFKRFIGIGSLPHEGFDSLKKITYHELKGDFLCCLDFEK